MIDFELVKGEGDFIFFLHGFGGSKESFKCVKNHIAGRCNMVFLSLPGFGLSPPPSQPYNLNSYAMEVRDLIIKLSGGKKVNIVCHSFGARVAVKLCYLYPYIIDKILIVDGAGIKPRRKLKYYIDVFQYKRMKKLVMKGKKDASILDNYGSSDYKSLSEDMKKTFVLVVNEDLKSCFRSIDNPILLFWGEKDDQTPLYMAKKINKLAKNSALIIAKNAGHFSYLDNFPLFIAVFENFFFS